MKYHRTSEPAVYSELLQKIEIPQSKFETFSNTVQAVFIIVSILQNEYCIEHTNI